MSNGLEWELKTLGPLELRINGSPVDLGFPKQRITLAVLVLHAGKHVGIEQLIYELWGEDPIASASENARGYVAGLRRLVTATHASGIRIIRAGGGYRLDLDAGVLDLAAYEEEVLAGRAAMEVGDLARAESIFVQAHDRWAGPLFEGLPRGPVLSSVCASIEQGKAGLVDDLAEVWLRQNQPVRAVALLQRQLSDRAVRERSFGLLMRARYQTDGPAAALEVYETARRTLAEQLGLEPGPELRELQRQVLRRDPAVLLAPERVVAGAPTTVPRQLPAAPTHFVGRDAEIARVQQVVLEQRNRYRPAVVVIFGPGGAGKSALAIRLGHDLASQYPDGQLYIDLLGSTPGAQPVPVIEVTHRLLHALGISRDQAPPSVDEATALLRSMTTGKRVLLVADNAAGAWQVAPLLPASDTCTVLITSRRPLTSLDAELWLRLEGIADRDARRLLDEVSGNRQIDSAAMATMLARCGGLPLALRVVAARLATRPDLPAAELALRLSEHRLDELQHDGVAVRSSIRASYEALTVDNPVDGDMTAQTFRLLGQLSATEITPGIAAAMLQQSDVATVRASLEHLVEAQLLSAAPNGRYKIHDLVGEAALEVALEYDSLTERRRRLRRAVKYHALTMQRAWQVVRPGTTWTFYCREPRSVTLPEFSGSRQAIILLDADTQNMLSVLESTASIFASVRLPWLSLSERLWGWLGRQCNWHAARRLSRLVVSTGTASSDDDAVALGEMLLGYTDVELGHADAAPERLRRSSTLFGDRGNRRGTALAGNALGLVEYCRHNNTAAIAYFDDAMSVLGDSEPDIRALVLANRCGVHLTGDRLDEAATDARECASLCRELGFDYRLAVTLIDLAGVELHRGRPAAAISHSSEVVELTKAMGDVQTRAEALLIRSVAKSQQGNHSDALCDIDSALQLVDKEAFPAKATALRHKAELLVAAGQNAAADRLLREASATPPTAPLRAGFIERVVVDVVGKVP